MPERAILIVVFALLAAVAGGILGWFLRAERFRRERLIIAAGWQEKLAAEEIIKERLRKQTRSLTGRLDDARRAERDARSRLAALESEFSAVVQSREQAETEFVDSQIALASSNRKRDELHRQLQHLLKRSREIMVASKAKDQKIFTLSRELESWQQRLPPLVYRFREKAKEATAMHEALDIERARARDLEDTLKTRILPLVDTAADATSRDGSDLQRLLREKETECRRLERELAAANAIIEQLTEQSIESDNGSGSVPVPMARDDLKRIKGVGPILERLLNEMGIFRLEQIAGFDNQDVERVQAGLKDFPDRIERDNWVGQARRLIREQRRGTIRDISDTRTER